MIRNTKVSHQYGFGITVILVNLMILFFDMSWESMLGTTIFLGFYFVIRLLSGIFNKLTEIEQNVRKN